MDPVNRTSRGRASWERIVDAACDLFFRRGVAATGLAEIIEASSTGKGQLYHYFRGKPDLVRAVAVTQAERVLRAQQDLLDTMATPADLRAWVTGAVLAHEGATLVRCPLGALAVELTDDDPALRESLATGFRRWREALAAGMTRLRDGGHLRADRSPEDLADALLSAYEGGVLLARVHGSTRPLRTALDIAVDGMLPRTTDARPGLTAIRAP